MFVTGLRLGFYSSCFWYVAINCLTAIDYQLSQIFYHFTRFIILLSLVPTGSLSTFILGDTMTNALISNYMPYVLIVLTLNSQMHSWRYFQWLNISYHYTNFNRRTELLNMQVSEYVSWVQNMQVLQFLKFYYILHRWHCMAINKNIYDWKYHL